MKESLKQHTIMHWKEIMWIRNTNTNESNKHEEALSLVQLESWERAKRIKQLEDEMSRRDFMEKKVDEYAKWII